MTEDEAQEWLRSQFGVSREALLSRYVDILIAESAKQNLIAASTIQAVWARHIVDSAQLLGHGGGEGIWLDVGSGAGLPGIVVACLTDRPVVLVEPRAKRVAFLQDTASALGLANVEVYLGKIETYRPLNAVSTVSARAVASLPSLLSSTLHCTTSSTIWVLPKGRNAQSEVDAARAKWQGRFHVEQSITDAESGIVIAQGVRPR